MANLQASYHIPKSKNKKILQIIALSLISIMLGATLMFLWLPGPAKGYIYEIFRGLSRLNAMISTWHMETIESEHFVIRYEESEAKNALLVAEAAEESLTPLADKYGLSINKKIPVILYSSREELNAYFGWPANESAMGVYWGGVIRVLSPDEWIYYDNEAEKRKRFFSDGPMAHELTHLMIDYKSRGNYPRWFTEGVAQYEEYRLTGGGTDSVKENFTEKSYSLQKMDGQFDSLPDQSLAYHQSLSMIKYIVEFYGEDKLHKIVQKSSTGAPYGKVFEDVLGVNLEQFEKSWLSWASKLEGHEKMTLNY